MKKFFSAFFFAALILLPAGTPLAARELVRPSGRQHCDTRNLKNLPQILLIGEIHSGFFGPLDAIANLKSDMVFNATERNIYAAFETGDSDITSMHYPWENKDAAEYYAMKKLPSAENISIIDSPLPYGLNISYRAAGGSASFPDIALLLRDNPYVRKAWEDVKQQNNGFSGTDLEPFARILDSAYMKTSFFDLRKQWLETLIKAEKSSPPTEFELNNEHETLRDIGWKSPLKKYLPNHDVSGRYLLFLAGKIYTQLVALTNESFLPALGLTQELIPIDAFREISKHDLSRASEDNRLLMIQVRDRDMADSLADIYCAAADDNGKNVVAMIGGGHIPGVLERLREWSDNRIQIRAVVPTDASRGIPEEILKELESAGAAVENAYAISQEISVLGRQ
ncbi:MAG: hypothetical protein WCU88_01970 [Elusimicrobiota bacterium]|jgi:hypothetical protein